MSLLHLTIYLFYVSIHLSIMVYPPSIMVYPPSIMVYPPRSIWIVINLEVQSVKMELNKVQVQELHPGINIRKKMVNLEQQLTYIFELDVQDLNIIDFVADFKGSENISIKGYGEEVTDVRKTVDPRTITLIAQVELHEGWKLKTTFRFLRRAISKDKQMMYIKPEIDIIETERKSMDPILRNVEVNLTPIEDINSLMEQSKMRFVDLDFPPEEYSILGNSDKSLIDDTVNHWRRPEDIFEKKPYYLIYKISNKNLVMGKLKDYAFYSVVSTLAMANEMLIDRLFFNQKSINPYGIYRLCLCKNGEWQTVNIDDYIPCEPISKPKFAASTLNQIWINLLQKAYAKVHNRYLSLYELEVSNVFNDLTGCPTFILDLRKPNSLQKVIENFEQKNIVTFYDIEDKEFDEDEFVPLKNYAYAMIGYKKEDGQVYFRFNSHNQTHEEIEGSEMKKAFKYACVCKVKNWEEVRVKGKFVSISVGSKEQSYSILMSRWYYSIEIHEACDLEVCLHQEDLLIGDNNLYKTYKYVSVVVFQKGDNSKLIPISLKKFAHNREFQFSLSLKPGIYLLVPVINSEFYIRKPPSQENYVRDIFRKLDLLMRRCLKYADLEPFFKVVGGVFDHAAFEQMLKVYTKDKKGIGFQGFKKMWEKNKLYWEDAAISYYSKEELFVLSLHSKQEINVLIKNNIGSDLNNRAHCELIIKNGKPLHLERPNSDYVKVIYYVCKSNIVEYMIENKFERKIKVYFDCSESAEYSFIPASGKITCELDSGEKKYLMKLIPKERSEINHLVRKENLQISVE